MIVDFTVSNFRSLRDEQTLSFYAENPGTHLTENIHYPVKEIGVLSSAGIYGPNASGKSNFLLALSALRWTIENSHSLKENEIIPTFEPYKLDENTLKSPVCFSLEFVVEGVRYIYDLHYTQEEVVYEHLRYYSVGEKRTTIALLYERKEGEDWDTMSFGGHFKGGARKIPFFKNQAYLSKAGNTPDAPPFIRQIYQFFVNQVAFVKQGNIRLDPKWKANTEHVQDISHFFNALDDGISSLQVKKRDLSKFKLPSDMPEELRASILEDFSHELFFERQSKNGYKALFSLDEESDGIRALIETVPLLMHVLRKGHVLIWDELENSLHPHVAELVLSLFNEPEINKSNAQLLFTTHNLALMNPEKMRKDQLWLVEKHDGTSELISLVEFDSSQLKNSSPFAKWYYDGRLGGLPSINYSLVKDLFNGVKQEGNDG